MWTSLSLFYKKMNWTWTCNLVYWWAQARLVFEIKLNVQSLTFNTWLNLVCFANHFNSYSIWVGKNKNAFKFLVVDLVVLISSVEPSLLYLELCMIVSCFRLLSLSVEISFSCSIFIQRIHMMGIFFFFKFHFKLC